MSPPHQRKVTLVSNEVVAPSTHVLTFTLPPEDPLEFVPGQYVTFYLSRNGRRVTRSYSIFSSALHHDRFRLLIKRIPDGFGSSLLCGLDPLRRPELVVLAPLGKFTLRPAGGRSILLVATGTGLAPFVPMLEQIRREEPSTPTWLFFGGRHAEDLVYTAEFRALETAWSVFHFVPIVSRPPADRSWTGRVGHVEEHVQRMFPDLSGADVYLCGVNEMVNEMQDLSQRLGCPKDRIFVERYGEDAEDADHSAAEVVAPAPTPACP